MVEKFSAAVRATDRVAVNRSRAIAAVLQDAELRDYCAAQLAEARGSSVSDDSDFTYAVWTGGMTDTLDGLRLTTPFADFKAMLEDRAQEVASKGAGFVMTPTSNTDGQRRNSSTTAMHALVLDCDGTGEPDQLAHALSQMGYSFIAYQSGGWTSGSPKWRILLPLAKPRDTSSDDRRRAWRSDYARARTLFGCLAGLAREGFDPTCDTPCHPWFLTERRQASDAPRAVVWRPGVTLDYDALLARLPPYEVPVGGSSGSRVVEPRVLDDAGLERIVKALCEPMQKITSTRRELYLALPGALLDRGLSADDVLTIVAAVSDRCPGEQDRHAEHIHCAETTISKWEAGEPYTRIGTLVENWPTVVAAIDIVLPNTSHEDVVRKLEERAAVKARKAGASAPAPAVDLKSLRKRFVSLRRKKLQSEDVEKNLQGLLVDRLLDGEALLEPDDPEEMGSRENVVNKLIWTIVQTFPLDEIALGWESFAVLAQRSLHAISQPEGLAHWITFAENCWYAALGARLEREEKRSVERDQYIGGRW